MFSKVIDIVSPPNYANVEQNQKSRFLHFSLFVIAGACFVLGIQSLPEKNNLDIFLFLVGAISLLCVPVNKKGHFIPVSLLISILMLGLITYKLIVGEGLHDIGLIAYPIYIIISSYLFNKKVIPHVAFSSMGSLIFVYFYDQVRYLDQAKNSNLAQLKTLFILILVVGLLLWVVMDNWERGMKKLRDAYDLTLLGWGQALEFRDNEIEGHSIRVANLTIELARRFGISEQEMDHIRRGALLHDIGKMAVPDAILFKNAPLSDSDWDVIKMHPVHARNFLEGIPFLLPALDIPYSHHERWDGQGYPEGLSGENIPFAARLFAVVDVWDALTSDRPYCQAWPQQKALEYIKDQSGKHFDPDVVKIFLEIMEEG